MNPQQRRLRQRAIFTQGFLHRVLHNKSEFFTDLYAAGFSAGAAYRYDGRVWREHAQEAWTRHEQSLNQSAA